MMLNQRPSPASGESKVFRQDKLLMTAIRQSILRLCRETVPYEHRLEVDGIVCITPENDTQQIVIKVHELLQRDSPSPFQNVANGTYGFSPNNFNHSPFPIPSSDKHPTDLPDSDATCTMDLNQNCVGMSTDHKDNIKSEPVDRDSEPQTSPMNEDSNEAEGVPLQADIQRYNRHAMASSFPLGFFSRSSLGSRPKDGVPIIGSPTEDIPNTPESSSIHQQICCKLCDLYFPNPRAFEEHSAEVHNTFSCGYCLNTFTSRPNLQRHIRLHTGQKPYSCPMCPSRFSRQDDLKGHILKHSYTKPFRCNLCEKGYTDRSCLKKHMRKEHNSTLRHVCPQCGEGFDNLQKSMQHKKAHPELERFQCHACSFVGTNPLSYQKHLLSHTASGKIYRCLRCVLPFTDAVEYSEHLKEHRSDPECNGFRCCFCDNILPTYEQFVRHEHSHAQNKCYTCHICSTQLKSACALKVHMLEHKERESDEDDSTDSKGGSQYWCTECNTGFSSEPSLGQHIAMVHESIKESIGKMDIAKPIILDDASPKKDNNQNVSSSTPVPDGGHENKSRSNTPLIRPPQDFPMNLSSNLASTRPLHERRPIYRPYSTPPVPLHHLPLLAPNNYLAHLNLAEQSFRVPVFGGNHLPSPVMWPAMAPQQQRVTESVSTEGSTAESPTTTAEEAGEAMNRTPSPIEGRPAESTSTSTTFDRITTPEVMFRMRNAIFQCDLCESQFKSFEEIETHSNQAHKRYLCEYCGKSFTAKPNRDRHVRYHTGERPYKCDLCDQSFFRGDDLKYHRTTRHSTVRPFHCTVCGLSFSWARDLERHVRTHV